MRVYDFICELRRLGVWEGVSGSCAWWSNRADSLTAYEWILEHEPSRGYGYMSRAAKALSNSKLGGGGTDSRPKRHPKDGRKYGRRDIGLGGFFIE